MLQLKLLEMEIIPFQQQRCVEIEKYEPMLKPVLVTVVVLASPSRSLPNASCITFVLRWCLSSRARTLPPCKRGFIHFAVHAQRPEAVAPGWEGIRQFYGVQFLVNHY